MGSSKKPPEAVTAAPPVSTTGADKAQNEIDQMRREGKRFDWSKTILRSNAMPANSPTGLKSTLG